MIPSHAQTVDTDEGSTEAVRDTQMTISKALGFAAAIGIAGGFAACTSAGPGIGAQAAAVQQARTALARWDAVVAAHAGGSGFVLVGQETLMIGGDWGPAIDGNNAKMAWGAGLFESATALPSETPPDAQVRWQDGATRTVPVISAAQAFADLKGGQTWPCADCAPLQVTSVKLTSATFDTSQGKALAPAWEFSLKDTPVKLDQIAVSARVASPATTLNPDATLPAGGQWTGPTVQSATVDTSGLIITATFAGAPGTGDKPCGADYTAQAVESDAGVVVLVYEYRNTLPAMCTAMAAFRTVQVTLSRPLGSRTLIDLDAQPISVAPAP